MDAQSLLGAWVLERTGITKDVAGKPSRWLKARPETETLEIRADGAFTYTLHGRTQPGKWTLSGDVLTVTREHFDPQRVVLDGDRLELREVDEEHGGWSVMQFARPEAPAVDDVIARIEKARDPKKLIDKERLVERAIRERNVALLTLCLGKGAAIYSVTFNALSESPAASLPALARALLASPAATRELPQHLAHDASVALVEAFVAAGMTTELRQESILAMFAGTFVRPDRKDVLAALVTSDLDIRDARGIPLRIHAITKAPADWVAIVKAAPDVPIAQPLRLALATGPVELPAGANAAQAAALALASIDAQITADPSSAPRLEASRERIRLALAV